MKLCHVEELIDETENGMKKIVILTADVGFGHRSAANAIYDGIMQVAENLPLKVEIVNLLEAPGAPGVLKRIQTEYDRVIKAVPRVYEFGYSQSDHTIPANLGRIGLSAALYNAYDEMMKMHQPDVIVSVFPLYQASAQTWAYINEESFEGQNVTNEKVEIEKEDPGFFSRFSVRRLPHTPYITVLTDFVEIHQLWLSKMPDVYTVANEETRRMAITGGIQPNRVYITGIPVKPVFATETRTKAEIREALGWDPNLTTVIAVGSKRVSKLMDNLNAVNHAGFDFQLILVAGGDDKLYREMKNYEWHHPVHIYNFTKDMPQMLLASDIAITKSGGLITSECLAAGLPMLLIDVLPGQEEGNAKLVVNNRCGILTKSPQELSEAFFHAMMNDGALLKEMGANARKNGHPRSSLDVCDIIFHFLKKQNLSSC